MSDNTITFSDEEMAEMEEGQRHVKELMDEARRVANNPDSYTKEEIAAAFDNFLDFFDMVNSAGQQFLEGSLEINRMTNA